MKPITSISRIIITLTICFGLIGCYCDEAPCPLNGSVVRLELPEQNGKIAAGTYVVEAAAWYGSNDEASNTLSAVYTVDEDGEVAEDSVSTTGGAWVALAGYAQSTSGGAAIPWIELTATWGTDDPPTVDAGTAATRIVVKLSKDDGMLYDETVEPEIEKIRERSSPSRLMECGYCEGSYTELRLP